MKRHFQSGLSMIEVLVTMVLIAIGSLALAGMQLAALKYNKEASLRSAATLLAVEISDRMRSNIAGVKASSYDRNLGYAAATAAVADSGCDSNTDCTAAAQAQLDIHNWQSSLKTALPGGAGAIIPSATTKYAYTVVVMWKDKSLSDNGELDPACTTAPVVGIRCFSTMFMP
jgi:type IV pilus assembly protein PilV